MTNFRGIVRIYRFRMEELEVCALVGWVTRSQVMIVRSHGHSSNLFRRPAAVISQLRSWKGTVNKIKSRIRLYSARFPDRSPCLFAKAAGTARRWRDRYIFRDETSSHHPFSIYYNIPRRFTKFISTFLAVGRLNCLVNKIKTQRDTS